MLQKIKIIKGILALITISIFFVACSHENALITDEGGYHGEKFVTLSVGVSASDSPGSRAVAMTDDEKAINNVIVIVVGADSNVIATTHWEGSAQGEIRNVPADKFPINIFTFANIDAAATKGTTAWALIGANGEELYEKAYEVKTQKELLQWKIKHRSSSNQFIYSTQSLPKTGIQWLTLADVKSNLTLAVKNRVARIDIDIASFKAPMVFGLLPRVESIGIERDNVWDRNDKPLNGPQIDASALSVPFYILPRSLSPSYVSQDIIMYSLDDKEYKIPMPSVIKSNFRYVARNKSLIVDDSPIELSTDAGSFKLLVTHTTDSYMIAVPSGAWLTYTYKDLSPALREYTFSYSESTAERNAAIIIQTTAGEVIAYRIPVKQEKSKDLTFKTLFTSSKPYPINFVIIGDGFIKEDNVENGAYDKAVKTVVDEFFSREPYKTYKEYFSVYQVYANSNKRGAMTYYDPNNYDTKFQAAFNYLGVERGLSLNAPAEVRNKYLYLPLGGRKPFLSLALVNDTRYGGIGGGLAVVSMNPDAMVQIGVHELSHKFNLSDEYVDPSVPQPKPADADIFWNLSSTGDRNLVKWKHFFNLTAYRDQVGVYEGGYYLAKGVWRSSDTSIMKELTVKYFNAVSREGIVKIIKEQAKEPYSFEDFLLKDKSANASYKALLNKRVSTKNYLMPPPPLLYWAEEKLNQIRR